MFLLWHSFMIMRFVKGTLSATNIQVNERVTSNPIVWDFLIWVTNASTQNTISPLQECLWTLSSFCSTPFGLEIFFDKYESILWPTLVYIAQVPLESDSVLDQESLLQQKKVVRSLSLHPLLLLYLCCCYRYLLYCTTLYVNAQKMGHLWKNFYQKFPV